MCWYGCVDESLCVGMGAWMNHCVLVWVCVRIIACWYGCVDESLCVGMRVWMNHWVLVWVCG